MQDGLYQVKTDYFCAAFTIRNGKVAEVTSILRKKTDYWKTIARKVRGVMKQKRTHSLMESITNVLIGFLVGLISQIIIFPFFNIHVPLSSNLAITGWFTLISIVRSYVIRRYYTNRKVRA